MRYSRPTVCCWCRCRPAGVTAETTAVDQPLLQAYRPARGRRGVRSCASVIPVSLCTGEAFRPRDHSSRTASTASLSTGKGTSCGPLVCLYYTRVVMHGKSFPSARVIVVVLALPSVLNVFPSVEPTTIVNVCIQFAGFEQN